MGPRFHISASISSAAEGLASAAGGAGAACARNVSSAASAATPVFRAMALTGIASSRPERPSGVENDLAPGGCHQQLVRHLLAHRLVEVGATAMHGDHDLRLELADLGHDRIEILLRRGPQVEAADDRVDLVHARHLLRLPHGVDNANMATRTDDDETAVLQVIAGRVFMDV